jgi:hypothetical protein
MGGSSHVHGPSGRIAGHTLDLPLALDRSSILTGEWLWASGPAEVVHAPLRQRYNRRLNTMRRLRTRKSLVLFGLAVVVFAAFVPALSSSLPSAILTPLWLVFPVVSIVVMRRTAARCDDQPVALLSLALFRAPPMLALA